jgi:hypothetical protein
MDKTAFFVLYKCRAQTTAANAKANAAAAPDKPQGRRQRRYNATFAGFFFNA